MCQEMSSSNFRVLGDFKQGTVQSQPCILDRSLWELAKVGCREIRWEIILRMQKRVGEIRWICKKEHVCETILKREKWK